MSPIDAVDDALRDLGADALVDVVGSGAEADELRARWTAAEGDPPDAIVVLTARTDDVLRALELVRPLGTVVVTDGHGLDLVTADVYRSIHARDVRLVGVGLHRAATDSTASPRPT